MWKPPKSAYFAITSIVLVLDQLSKAWVREHLPLYYPRQIFAGFLNFTHVENSGVAFGWFAANGEGAKVALLTGLGIFALLVVGLYYWQTPRSDRQVLIALSLILGGAIGNLIDRILAGKVTDFVDFYVGDYHWHTFNVADSAITVGIFLLTLDIIFGGFTKRRHLPESEPSGSLDRPDAAT